IRSIPVPGEIYTALCYQRPRRQAAAGLWLREEPARLDSRRRSLRSVVRAPRGAGREGSGRDLQHRLRTRMGRARDHVAHPRAHGQAKVPRAPRRGPPRARPPLRARFVEDRARRGLEAEARLRGRARPDGALVPGAPRLVGAHQGRGIQGVLRAHVRKEEGAESRDELVSWRWRALRVLTLVCFVTGATVLVPLRGRAQSSLDFLRSESDTTGLGRGLAGPYSGVARTLPRPTLQGAVDPRTYLLGPGDVLSLDYGGRALRSGTLVVDAQGRLRVTNLGAVSVGGKSLEDARDEILHRLARFFPGATLQLRLVQPRTFKVYVLGEVDHPGLVEVVGSTRVMEAIEASGGLTDKASTRNIQVIRRDGTSEMADVERFRRTGDWQGNPFLRAGDRSVVPTVIDRIGVFGAVPRPGWLEYHSGDSLLTILHIAGGPLPEARLDSVRVIRYRGATGLDTLVINLSHGMDYGLDIVIEPDDRIFIPSQFPWRPSRQVTISGEVVRPGVYAITEGRDRVSDLVGWGGGFTGYAARRNVHLERRPETDEKDIEFERLNRLSRSEMTDAEYQTFRSKLALRQASYLIDFS